MHLSLRLIAGLVVAILVALPLAGCEQAIDPIIGEDRPFTLWGYFDANADTQRVRVFSIEQRLGTDRSGPIDAVVISKDLATGETHSWTDTEVAFNDSVTGHVFWSAFKPEYERAYRLEVRRSDGATSSVEVTIPPHIDVELVDPTERVKIPVFIHGKPPNLVGVQVVYDAITLPPANPWPPGSTSPPGIRLPVSVPYTDKVEPTADGWKLELNLRQDFGVVQKEFDANCLRSDLVTLRRIDFRFLAADADWSPPRGSFDPNLLIEPGAFSNVENGFGFYGGGYVSSTRWISKENVLRSIGYVTSGPCPLMPQNIPICQLPPEPCLKSGGGN